MACIQSFSSNCACRSYLSYFFRSMYRWRACLSSKIGHPSRLSSQVIIGFLDRVGHISHSDERIWKRSELTRVFESSFIWLFMQQLMYTPEFLQAFLRAKMAGIYLQILATRTPHPRRPLTVTIFASQTTLLKEEEYQSDHDNIFLHECQILCFTLEIQNPRQNW